MAVFVFAAAVGFSVGVAAVVAAVVVPVLKLTVLSSERGELRMLKPTLLAGGVVMIPRPW